MLRENDEVVAALGLAGHLAFLFQLRERRDSALETPRAGVGGWFSGGKVAKAQGEEGANAHCGSGILAAQRIVTRINNHVKGAWRMCPSGWSCCYLRGEGVHADARRSWHAADPRVPGPHLDQGARKRREGGGGGVLSRSLFVVVLSRSLFVVVLAVRRVRGSLGCSAAHAVFSRKLHREPLPPPLA